MEYKAVVRRNSDNDLTHHKYIRREKVRGKWRYYYTDTKSNSGKNGGYNLNEMAAKVTRGEFGNGRDRKEALGDSYNDIQKRVNRNYQNIDYNAKNEQYKNAQKRSKSFNEYTENTLKRGHNMVMKLLNNIGDGTIDDKARKRAKKNK